MTTPTPARGNGRGWAYTGATLGGLVSIAANIAHSFVPPTGHTTPWHPERGAIVSAIVWPVFLFVAVEILARTPWPRQLGWALARWAGLLPVALVAAFVSYRHLSGLLAHYGEEPIVTVLGPLAVDGLMIMATAAILATGHRRTNTPQSTPAATIPVPAAAPAVVPVEPTAPAVAAPLPVVVAESVVPSVSEQATPVTAFQPEVLDAPAPALPSRTDIPVTPANGTPPASPVPASMLTRAAHVADAHHNTSGTRITANELAVQMRVNSKTAAMLLDQLATATRRQPSTTPVNGHRVDALA
jgi:hypothetical protein